MSSRLLRPILTACLALVAGAARGDPLPPGAVARLGSPGIQPAGSVAFSPDRKVLAVYTRQPIRQVQFWNTTTGARGPSLDPGPINFFRFVSTAAGCFFAAGDADEIRFMDVRSGKVVRRFKGPGRFLECLALSPDGKLLATASGLHGTVFEPHEVILWDLARGKELARLEGHKTWVSVLAFSADGKRLLSSSEDYERTTAPTIDGGVCVWDVAGRKLLRQFKQRGKYVSFSPDGRTAGCRGKDWRARLWDLETGRERARLPEEWMYPVFLPDGKTVALGGDKEMLGLWNLEGKKVRSFRGYIGAGVSPVGVSPYGKLLATIGGERLRLWDVAKGEERRLFGGHLSAVSCVAFAGGGKVLVSGGKDMTLRVWDAGSGKELLVYDKHHAALTAVACSPDGKTVASGDEANAVHLWDRSTGALRHRFVFNPTPPADGDGTGIASLVFSADGKTLFAASRTTRNGFTVWGKTVCLDPSTGRVFRTVGETGSGPTAIAPDGRTVACISLALTEKLTIKSNLLLRSPYTGSVLSRVDEGMQVMFDGAAFSSDGKMFAECSRSLTGSFPSGEKTTGIRCRLQEVATGKEVLTLAGGSVFVNFSPDGKILAAVRAISPAPGRGKLTSWVAAETGKLSGPFRKYV